MRGWKVRVKAKAQAKAKKYLSLFKVEGGRFAGVSVESEAEDGRGTKTEDGGRRAGGIGTF